MTTYKVLRAFRMPKNGGMAVPYRIYETGVTVTSADMAVWDLDAAQLAAEVLYLTTTGAIALLPSLPAPPAPTPAQKVEIAELEKAGLVIPAPPAAAS